MIPKFLYNLVQEVASVVGYNSLNKVNFLLHRTVLFPYNSMEDVI